MTVVLAGVGVALAVLVALLLLVARDDEKRVATERLAEPDGEAWAAAERAFRTEFKKKSVKFKKLAISGLPLDDERTITFIIEKERLFNSPDWWVRVTAAEHLAGIKTPSLRKVMHSYAEHADTRVRECVIAALAMSKDDTDKSVIIDALKDPAWEVRRTACIAAGRRRLREAVEPMIAMIHDADAQTGRITQKGERDPRVQVLLTFNLEEITGKNLLTNTRQWRAYWAQNKDKPLPAVRRFDRRRFGTIETTIADSLARRGSGPLVVVLPMAHRHTTRATYYLPYFSRWLFAKWLFVNFPTPPSLPGGQRADDGDAVFAVATFVNLIEEIRQKMRVEKIVVLGHDLSCLVAARYAQEYPGRVQGLILVNPCLSDETLRRRVDEARGSRQPDDEFWAKVMRGEAEVGSASEAEQVWYVECSRMLGDKSDIEIALLRDLWRNPAGPRILIPAFDIRGEQTSRVPALMFFSRKGAKYTNLADMKRLKKYYRRYITVSLGKSTQLPFMEEPDKFEQALRMFLAKYDIR